MTPLGILLTVFLVVVETLASYVSRVYAEFGKIHTREVQENLDAWEEKVEPLIGLSRDHAYLSAAVLQQLALGLMVLVVAVCNQLLPSLLFNRTRGLWAARIIWPVRLLLWIVTPITAILRFFF